MKKKGLENTELRQCQARAIVIPLIVIPFFKGMSRSKTIFIILVMKREGETDPRKKEKKRKKSRSEVVEVDKAEGGG